jgi:hypothetical protein
VGSTSVHVPLTDNCESDRCLRLNLSRAIHKGARILSIADADSNCSRIKCDWLDALILDLADEHDRIVSWEAMHFLDGSDHFTVIADIRYLALFIAIVQPW